MDFIVENYMWFIIGGIVILMAVIGYIADVTDFGRNRIETKTKEKKQKTKKEKIKEDKPVQEVSLEPITEMNNEINNESQTDEVQDNQLGQEINFTESNNDMENSIFSNEINDSENNTEDESVDQSLFEPLPSVDQVFQTANKLEDDYSAPTEETEVASNDDIWKF